MARRTTLKDVAAYAGVSYQTVSKVINRQIQVSKETQERIMEAVDALGYRPDQVARSMRLQRTCLIGYSWAPASPDQVNPILDRFLQSMVQVAESAGYHLLTFPYQAGEAALDGYRELISTNRVDGFVISSVEYADPRAAFLLKQNFPFVAFGRSNPEMDFPFVDIDGADGMRQVVEHLLEQGHQRICALGWPADSRVGQNRLDGLLAALAARGLNLPPASLLRGQGTYQFGYQAAQTLLERPPAQRPTAIIAFNDAMAVGAMNAVQQRGLQVGQDIAITGFDDAPMVQYLTPPLTSVRQPIWEVGQRTLQLLLDILDEKTPAERQALIAPQLIIRSSSLTVEPYKTPPAPVLQEV